MTRRLPAAITGGASAVLLAAWLALAAAAGIAAGDIPGVRPSYGPANVADVSNAAAITHRVWAPGLDAGYNPQGLALSEGAVLVSAYRSEEYSRNRGPCRVFRLDPRTGQETGHADVPAPCGHAGGLATTADGYLYVADTRTLFEIPLARAFAGGTPLFRRFPLGPDVIGGLAISAGDAIWLAAYLEDRPARLRRFDRRLLAALRDSETLTAEHAAAAVTIPAQAQGAAIDRDGKLWVARSTGRWGELDRLNAADGTVERRYDIAAGIEGIAADPDGRLWAVSESGARHTYDNLWAPYVVPFYPLVFSIDPARLK